MDDLQNVSLTGKVIGSGVILLVAVLASWAIKRGLQHLTDQFRLPTLALRPLRIVFQYGIVLIAILLILAWFDLPLQGVMAVAASMLTLLAIGFVALWSVLSNLLCTFVLIVFKPFAIGDEIEFPTDNIGGKVVDLSLVFTTLQDEEGAFAQVPNNLFFQKLFRRRPGKAMITLDEQLKKETPTVQ